MKKYILLITLLCLTACKTRQVTTSKTAISTTTQSTAIIKKDSLKIDTGKKHTEIKKESIDTGVTELDITTDTGTIQKLYADANGNITYTGKAKNILLKDKKNIQATVDENIQENKAEITQNTITDSVITHTDTQQVTKNKSSVATPDFKLWLMALGFIFVLGAGCYLFYRLRAKL